MANESASEKKLFKLIKQDVFSSEITDALTEVLETINSQRKQHVQPQPFQRPKSFKRWTKEEESKLISNFLDGTTIDKIAEQHQRSCNAIFHRLLLTGIVSLSETINFNNPIKPKNQPTIFSLPVKEKLPGRICTTCGERIDPLRLSSMPNTYRCVSCQKDFEKRTGLSMGEYFI